MNIARTTTTSQPFHSGQHALSHFFGETLAVAKSERVGASKRRRDRRLRAWHRDEQLTVAMELAAALHHSAQRPKTVVEEPKEEVENVTHDGLRAQKSPPPGMRPGSLLDPGPQRSLQGDAPLLVVASLAGGDAVDATTVSFLLRCAMRELEEERNLEKRRRELEEAEEERMLELNRPVSAVDPPPSTPDEEEEEEEEKTF